MIEISHAYGHDHLQIAQTSSNSYYSITTNTAFLQRPASEKLRGNYFIQICYLSSLCLCSILKRWNSPGVSHLSELITRTS